MTALPLVLLFLVPAAAPAVDEGMKVSRDVRYGKIEGVDPNLLSLDVYAPETKGKHPVLVMIHGGGWRSGDKASRTLNRFKAPHFVGRGFVYVSINYRLTRSPDDPKHPAHVQDAARALAWLHDHLGEYGGDPDRIYVMGHSAGAHLAALVSTDHRRLEAEGKKLSIIKGTICLDTAAYDIPRYVNELKAGPVMRRLYENAFGTAEEAWRDASPRHHVAPKKGIPPMLFFHTGRRMEGEQLSRELVAALRQAGTAAQSIHAADKDHRGINVCIGQPGDRYTKLIMAFLENPRRANELFLDEPGAAATGESSFAALDGNSDGRISRDEYKTWRRAPIRFDDADRDGDGFITIEEARENPTLRIFLSPASREQSPGSTGKETDPDAEGDIDC